MTFYWDGGMGASWPQQNVRSGIRVCLHGEGQPRIPLRFIQTTTGC